MREPVFEGHSSVWAGTNHVPSPVPPGRDGTKDPVDRKSGGSNLSEAKDFVSLP